MLLLRLHSALRPLLPTRRETWTPRESWGMFFVIGCMLTSTAQLRAKSQVSGRWSGLCACQQRRQEDEGRGSRLNCSLQALSHFRLVSP